MTARDERGYSLVELVVAMMLLGIIALAVENGLHFGTAVWERSELQTGTLRRTMVVQNLLRNIISRSLPRMEGNYVTFVGEPTRISFEIDPPLAFQEHGTARAILSVERRGHQDRLLLTMQSRSNPATQKQASIDYGGHGLRFAYLDASGRAGTWLSFWRDRSRLPDAVRVSTADPSSWPVLVIRPVISQSATCALDPVSMTCRKT